jgi:siroheme synthase
LPLTDRRYSSSIVFLTGHEDLAKGDTGEDWAAAAHAETVVIYMGWKRLRGVLARLAAQGIPSSRPVALIASGTLAREQVVLGTLEDIEAKVKNVRMESPVIIIVGEVVKLLERRPPECLSGKRYHHLQEEQSL